MTQLAFFRCSTRPAMTSFVNKALLLSRLAENGSSFAQQIPNSPSLCVKEAIVTEPNTTSTPLVEKRKKGVGVYEWLRTLHTAQHKASRLAEAGEDRPQPDPYRETHEVLLRKHKTPRRAVTAVEASVCWSRAGVNDMSCDHIQGVLCFLDLQNLKIQFQHAQSCSSSELATSKKTETENMYFKALLFHADHKQR